MIKIAVIWDLHGKDIWKKITKDKSIDQFMFLWDYVDSFTVSDKKIVENLKEIINFKKEKPEKVVLLLWNHDVQYIYEWYNCSGKRKSYARILRDIFLKNLKLFKIMHQEWKYYFSHAWLTKEWIDDNITILLRYGENFTEAINNILHSHHRYILMQVSPKRGWHNRASGPLWADKSETEHYVPDIDMHQIVWHTPVKSIKHFKYITYCDNLEHGNGEIFILEVKENK